MKYEYDVVIKGGTVVDGSGGEPFFADVAIKGDRIVAVGEISGHGAQEISAAGRLVTPGFVDIHTHYDGQITWESTLGPSSRHGVTTVVMGNCGVGFAPCKPENRALLITVMEGVEDIPEVVMAAGLPWNWESFPEYLDMLSQRHADIDFAAQIPHAPIRVHVMGQRGADREPPTDADLAEMTRLVAEAIRSGAVGVSTSRSIGHRTAAGEPAPTTTSEERELAALAQGLREAGSGVFQLISAAHEGLKDPLEELAMLRRLTEISGRPLSFTLLNTNHVPEVYLTVLEQLSLATAAGVPIRAQVFPRPVGVLFGLELSFHPFKFNPSYKAIEHLPLAERVMAMRAPDLRARILAEQPEHTNPIFLYFANQAEQLFPLGDPPNYEPLPEDKLSARAQRMGISARELSYDLLLEQDGHATLLLPAANYVDGSLEPVRTMLEHPDTLVGLGDGGAHYGMICDGSYTTSLIAYWTRDRTRGPRLPLPWAIRALTRLTAQAVGLNDRGLIAPGMKADINVIDYDRLQLHAPRVVSDLPAGGRRLTQDADGYDATIMSGVITYRNGAPTGAKPGRLVRNRNGVAAGG
jgi:N-acyl-D-aspartate/D-glutamate deacylase